MKIENSNEPFEVETKRFHAPIKVRATCPECGNECGVDYSDLDALYFPKLNVPMMIGFYCYTEVDGKGIHHEFEKKVILRVTMEEAQ